jgi:hypothetical protein
MGKTVQLRVLVGIAALVPILGVNACGKDESSGSSNLSIVLRSSQLASSLIRGSAERLRAAAATACTATVDAATVNGTCYTPLAVAGAFNEARLSSSAMGANPVRLLGGGSQSGVASVFKHADFDLKASPTIQGEDNIEGAAVTTFSYLNLRAQYVEVSFVATPANKAYHVRTFFVNNVPSTDSVLSAGSCRVSTALTEADAAGTLFSGMTAQAGDIMVCVKATSSETCSDSDYQWVTTGGALSSTRPSPPKQQSGANLVTATTCPSDGANWGYGSVNLGFPSDVTISASFSEGKKVYTAGGKSGEKLTFSLDVSLGDSLFVPSSTGIADLATANETAVLANIDQILLKPMYVSKHRTGGSAGDAANMLSATPTLTVE